jgi:putative sterol carrier protein
VAYRFLSPEWFAEVARLRAEAGDLDLPQTVRELVINLQISDAPEGTIEARINGGALELGAAPDAPTTLSLPYGVARKIFVDQDRMAGMQAFMTGKIKVSGDFTKLMAMQGAGETPQSRALVEKISAMTS